MGKEVKGNLSKKRGFASEITNEHLEFIASKVGAITDKKQDKLTFDDAPTEGSKNPVTSGGVAEALENKADKTEIPAKMSELENDAGLVDEETLAKEISAKENISDKVSEQTELEAIFYGMRGDPKEKYLSVEGIKHFAITKMQAADEDVNFLTRKEEIGGAEKTSVTFVSDGASAYATQAVKAVRDENGNDIAETYVTKAELDPIKTDVTASKSEIEELSEKVKIAQVSADAGIDRAGVAQQDVRDLREELSKEIKIANSSADAAVDRAGAAQNEVQYLREEVAETYAEKANAITKKLKASDVVDTSPVTYSFNGDALMFGYKNTDNMPVNIASMAIRDDLYNNIRETYATKDELKSAVDGIDLSDCVQYGDETDIKYMRGNISNEKPFDTDVFYSPCCYRYDNCIIIASSKLTCKPMSGGYDDVFYEIKTTQIRIDSEQNIATRYGKQVTSNGNTDFPRIDMDWYDWHEYITTSDFDRKTSELSETISKEYATKSELSESEATAADTYAKKSDMGITMEYVSGTDTKYYLSQGSAYYVYNGSKVQFYDYDGNKLTDIDGNTISSSKAFLFVMPSNYADGNLKLYRNLAGWKTTLGAFESCNTDTYLDKPCYFKLVSGGPAMVYKLKFSE